MLFGEVYARFVQESPLCVMARGLLERALCPQQMDALFDAQAERQYTQHLLFSTVVDLMATVVCRTRRSVHAAYQAQQAAIGVSVRALYDKLECLEPGIAAAVVRPTATQLAPLITQLHGAHPPLLPGYTVKILDGNHLARSQRRLKILRDVAAGPLPGQTLVILEPETGLATGVLCSEDGHAQERKLLAAIWPCVTARDLWIADRNFCTTGFLVGLIDRQSHFVIRQHGSTLQWQRDSPRRRVGRTATGVVYEQRLWLEDDAGHTHQVRRITVVLDHPTQDGDREIHLLTNLPARVRTTVVATLYLERWTIEGLFQNLTVLLRCEVNTLAYPKAALFGFCVALAAHNVLATVKAALRGAWPQGQVDDVVSDYYVAEELAGTYRGMMIALPAAAWLAVGTCTEADFVAWLLGIARQVHLPRYQKHVRGPKKPRQRRTTFAKARHVATARLLAQAKGKT